MRKYFCLVLALVVMFGGISFADLQIDEGMTRGQAGAVSKFFVARNARVAEISADRVVIWDTTSNDGVTVTTSTTSFDNLVAGVTIDRIPGITSDATAASNVSTGNYGRVRVYGRHASVSFDGNAATCLAGSRVAAGGGVAGTATSLTTSVGVSGDGSLTGNSGDALGIALEACATANKTLDVFIQKG